MLSAVVSFIPLSRSSRLPSSTLVPSIRTTMGTLTLSSVTAAFMRSEPLRGGSVRERTRDHSHVELLLREGLIHEHEMRGHPMRNFVECCLGGEPFLPEMSLGLREPLEANDILLVCSDGLWGGLDDDEIGGAFPPARAPLKDELQRLAERSISVVGAGSDNTSAAIVRWIGNA